MIVDVHVPEIFREESSIVFHCGIEFARLQAWVDEAQFEDAIVSLEPIEDRQLARLTLPVTMVRIEGDHEAIEDVYAQFLLRFMSAGG